MTAKATGAKARRHSPVRISPLAKAALAEARRSFAGWPGICGFGIGKKFFQRDGRLASPRGTPKLFLHVFVCEKRTRVRAEYRLPSCLNFRVRGNPVLQKINIDVIGLGTPVEQDDIRVVTATGQLPVGRLFGFSSPQVALQPGGYNIGTAGAHVTDDSGFVYAISSGHVFIDTCAPPWNRPTGSLKLHLRDGAFNRTSTSLLPQCLGTPPYLIDGMAIQLPKSATPGLDAAAWPPSFDGRFADQNDIARALALADDGAFVWVERAGGVSVRLRVNLIGHGFDISIPKLCPNVSNIYPYFWSYLFPEDSDVTISGDSGAGLYVPDATDRRTPKLLGFHFAIHTGVNGDPIGTAIPAENFVYRTFASGRLYCP